MSDGEEPTTPEGEGSACQTIGVSEDQPPLKRRKENFCPMKKSDLETRLLRVLSCSVCLDLPSGAIYQCSNGHLSCHGCFSHLLADARLKNESATCPSCRIEINYRSCSRNLAVESAVSELPTECRHCRQEFTRSEVIWHENELCMKRRANCKFSILGCSWEGIKAMQQDHEEGCDYPFKSGEELMKSVSAIDEKQRGELTKMKNLVQMFSCEKISFSDIQLSPCRSDDFIPKLYYESNRFSAFDQTWTVKASVQGNEKSLDRRLAYQLISRNKCNLEVKYFLIKGPFGELDIVPELQRFEFMDDKKETGRHPVLLKQASDCNRLLSTKTISLRIIMFLIGK